MNTQNFKQDRRRFSVRLAIIEIVFVAFWISVVVFGLRSIWEAA